MGYWELRLIKNDDRIPIHNLTNDEIGKIIDMIRERNESGDLEDEG
jgi:hypothetical protein